MQLLQDHQTLMATVRDINMMSSNMLSKDTTCEAFEVKEKRSSDASLMLMNPVASGDNVATGLNSAHKLKEEPPTLVPCCEGRELRINEELVKTGLSAISVKHDNSVIQCLSMSRACERLQVQPGLVKHRNSFRSLHRPDLKRVPYLRRMTPDELETLFKGYATDLHPGRHGKHGVFTERDESRILPISAENYCIRDKKKDTIGPDDGNLVLHPIPETRSGAEDVPAGMRLHGVRARLYTSVLAGAKAGDQLDALQGNEVYDTRVADDPLPEEEVQLHEELQIILPPRCDDINAESSTTTATDGSTS